MNQQQPQKGNAPVLPVKLVLPVSPPVIVLPAAPAEDAAEPALWPSGRLFFDSRPSGLAAAAVNDAPNRSTSNLRTASADTNSEDQ